MKKKILLMATFLMCSVVSFAQQIPVGLCGIVYIYDANGARVKRVYFCNNGTEPYPQLRATQVPITPGVVDNEILQYTKNDIVFEKIEAIYPNPTTGVVYVQFSQPILNATIIVVDVNGQLIKTLNGNSQILQIDLSQCNAGVYFLKISAEGKQFTHKIIKK